MTEHIAQNEKTPVSREEVIAALKESRDDATEILIQYNEELILMYGDTTPGRLSAGEALISVYQESGFYEEAWQTAEEMLDMIDGERNEETIDLGIYQKFLDIQKAIEAHYDPETTTRTN